MRNPSQSALVGGLLAISFATAAGCAGSDSSASGPATSAATPSTEASEATRVFSFDFDDLPGTDETSVLAPDALTLRNAGSELFTVKISTRAGGTLRSVPDPEGGRALRFPAFTAQNPKGGVLTITTSSVTDPLAPGISDFSFGADINLDAVSEGALDNGNNLMQRGLSADPVQYKLQVDDGQASCRIAGEDGEVVVRADQVIEPGTWYTLSCTRKGNQVTLGLGVVGGPAEQSIEVGATGGIYLSSEIPVVLGGKADAAGVVIGGDSDQFNGVIDNAFLEIDEEP